MAENQTDFIFAVAGEEYGFIGCTTIILLLLAIALECIRMGLRAKDLSGKIICCGMGSIVAFQLSEYLRSHRNGAEYRNASSLCKLWTDLSYQSL